MHQAPKGQTWLNFEDAEGVLLDPHETTYKYEIQGNISPFFNLIQIAQIDQLITNYNQLKFYVRDSKPLLGRP